MINNIKAFAKFIDQPILISKFNKSMPKLMCAAGGTFLIGDTYESFSKYGNNRRTQKSALRKAIVVTTTIASAMAAPKIASKIMKRPSLESISSIRKNNADLIDNFLKDSFLDKKTREILNNAKNEPLSFCNVKRFMNDFKKSPEQQAFFNKLIPNPENITSKDIFSEIGYLSIYGAVPVIGGVVGGISADIVTKDNFKSKISDKINEGVYQYLANIFLCNVGAGGALWGLEARALGMTAGIILTGVVGGSAIANAFSNKVLSPIMKCKEKTHRTPEALDIGLHADDVATVSLLSGLKWIEPALPLLYSISGYRAGMGYRN